MRFHVVVFASLLRLSENRVAMNVPGAQAYGRVLRSFVCACLSQKHERFQKAHREKFIFKRISSTVPSVPGINPQPNYQVLQNRCLHTGKPCDTAFSTAPRSTSLVRGASAKAARRWCPLVRLAATREGSALGTEKQDSECRPKEARSLRVQQGGVIRRRWHLQQQ